MNVRVVASCEVPDGWMGDIAMMDVVFPAICMERRTFFAQGLVEKEQKKRGTVFMERNSYLVDPASSHMLVSKIKPCMSKYARPVQ